MGGLRECAVVYFGNDWSAENRTSSHHIARRLAGMVPVLYVETPGSRAPQSSSRDARKLWRKLTRMLDPPRRVQERLYVVTVPQIPFRKLPLAGWANRKLGERLVRRAIARLGFQKLISWFVVPHPAALAKRLGEVLTVYYCIDDYAAHPGMDVSAIQALDDRLTRVADVVFVAPRALVEAKRSLNPRVYFSPHGVDYELFSQAADPAEAAAGLRHPIVGYFGSLAPYINVDLLVYLARSRPEWTFLFVGYVSADVSRLRECGNVVLAGPQAYETLPRWAAAFDVAICPYQVNRQVKNSNPLKLREYLATGKPVVSVAIPETAQFADCVYLAEGPEEFLASIDRALAEDRPELQARRMQAVVGSSWDARFRETVAVVEEALTAAT